ncbi:MAG TPA: sulfotransferase [Chitinophagales bacterium]|nr:sulfotransferase [Chitinophagales bacterium]
MAAKPTFLIVGAVKAGTTSIHEYLQMHPEVYMSPVKETNHFSDADMLFDHFNVDYKQDINANLEKYLAGPMDKKIHIAHVRTAEQYAALFKNVTSQKAIGEVSNSYLYLPSTARAIHKALPDVQIVMILRNPVERLYSQFLMNLKLGKIVEKDLLKEIEADQVKPVKGWGVSHLYLEVGMYYEQVKRYLDIFDKNKVCILYYDDYKKDPTGTMQSLFKFLGVDATFTPDMSKRYNEAGMPRFGKLNYWLTQIGVYGLVKRIFPSNLKERLKSLIYTKENIPTITAEEKEYLINYYRKDIEQLQLLLNKDLSNWLK